MGTPGAVCVLVPSTMGLFCFTQLLLDTVRLNVNPVAILFVIWYNFIKKDLSVRDGELDPASISSLRAFFVVVVHNVLGTTLGYARQCLSDFQKGLRYAHIGVGTGAQGRAPWRK